MTSKTLIAIMASHDDADQNESMQKILDEIALDKNQEKFEDYGFVFTGGTFQRVILGNWPGGNNFPVSEKTLEFLSDKTIVLPDYQNGGNSILSYLISNKKIGIIWSFIAYTTSHVISPENTSLMRLCDIWRVKRFLNEETVRTWLEKESMFDKNRNRQPFPLKLLLRPYSSNPRKVNLVSLREWLKRLEKDPKEIPNLIKIENKKIFEFILDKFQLYFIGKSLIPKKINEQTLALAVQKSMREDFVDFAMNYENELINFKTIITTKTTGQLLIENAPALKDKIYQYHTGSKGGFTEIATEVFTHNCHAVVTFLDPLSPEPHLEDFKSLIGSTVINKGVQMITNNSHAIEWMEHVIKPEIYQ